MLPEQSGGSRLSCAWLADVPGVAALFLQFSAAWLICPFIPTL
jgi:hypothetical protein